MSNDGNKLLDIFDNFVLRYREEVNKSLEDSRIPINDRWRICKEHGVTEYCFNSSYGWKCEESQEIWNKMMEHTFDWNEGSYDVWEEIFENYKNYIIEHKDLGCLDKNLFDEIPDEDDDWDENENFTQKLDEILSVLYIGEKVKVMNYF